MLCCVLYLCLWLYCLERRERRADAAVAVTAAVVAGEEKQGRQRSGLVVVVVVVVGGFGARCSGQTKETRGSQPGGCYVHPPTPLRLPSIRHVGLSQFCCLFFLFLFGVVCVFVCSCRVGGD